MSDLTLTVNLAFPGRMTAAEATPIQSIAAHLNAVPLDSTLRRDVYAVGPMQKESAQRQ